MVDMAEFPNYLEDRTAEVIHAEMLNDVPDDLDRSEGSYIFDATAPAANQLQEAAFWVIEMLRRGFASTTFEQYLEARGEEAGLFKLDPLYSKGVAVITGSKNTTYPTKGKRAAVPTDPGSDEEPISYTMETDTTTNNEGKGYVNITAVTPGKSGNVPVGSISILLDPIDGVTSINNETPTKGGADRETDDAFRERYFQKRRNPSSSGNNADYTNWAGEVQGVGGVVVVPVDEGNGTVGVYIINEDKLPASEEMVESVQDYVYPPYKITEQSTSAWITKGAVLEDVIDATDEKATKINYEADGAWIERKNIKLDRPGLWTFRPVVKADNKINTTDIIGFGVYDEESKAYLRTTTIGTELAYKEVSAEEIGTVFGEQKVRFYWDGRKKISWRIIRPVSIDAAPVVHTLEPDVSWINAGYGGSIDTQEGMNGVACVKLVFNSAGNSKVSTRELQQSPFLSGEGEYYIRVRVKVDTTGNADELYAIAVQNHVASQVFPRLKGSADKCERIYRAADLSTDWMWLEDTFYWDGTQPVEIWTGRIPNRGNGVTMWVDSVQLEKKVDGKEYDKTSAVWVDQVKLISDFSTETGEGLAPMNSIVYVKPAKPIPVKVSVKLVINPAYTPEEVKEAVKESLESYRRETAFKKEHPFYRYSRVTQAIIDTPGVDDFEDLTINGDVRNIPIIRKEVIVQEVIFL